MSGYTLERADAALPLTIEGDVLRWAGPSDPDEGAPILRFECRLDEGEAIEDLVARYPMPATLVATLAERFVDVSLDTGALRWRRALAAARLARGERVAEIARGEVVVRMPGPIRGARVERDGTLLATTAEGATIRDRHVVDPPTAELYMIATPPPLDPACGQHLVVSRVYESNVFELRAFDRDSGETVGSYSGIAPGGYPDSFSVAAGGWWLHDEDSHVFVGAGEVAVIENSIAWAVVGRWLFVCGDGDVWHWHDLDRREEPRAIELGDATPTLRVVGTELWIGSKQGLFRAAAGEPLIRVFEGRVDGIAIEGDRAWLGSPDSVASIDLPSGTVRWRTKLGHGVWVITRITAGVVAAAWETATVLDDTGQILVALEARRDVGVRSLADGTAAISVGEHVAIVAPDGVVHRPMPLPYDGWIAGATRDRFVFGPIKVGGASNLAPDAFYALDRTGAITARLPFVAPLIGCSDDHVVIQRDRAVVQWDPRGAAVAGVTAASPPREPVHRGQRSIAGPIGDPRSEMPQVGISVSRDTLLIDCAFGGSTGEYLTEVPFRVTDGAIATFYRCDLLEGDAFGEVVSRGATAILVQCRVPANVTWTASPDSHLVMIECTIGG